MSSLLKLKRKQKVSSNAFRIRIFLFRSYSFGIETINTFIHSRSSLEKPYPIPDQNGQSVYPFSDQKGPRIIPFGAAHTYMAYIREYCGKALQDINVEGTGSRSSACSLIKVLFSNLLLILSVNNPTYMSTSFPEFSPTRPTENPGNEVAHMYLSDLKVYFTVEVYFRVT